MNGEQVVRQARERKAAFGVKCRKFSGAVSVEILKAALTDEGIRTSPRDVFVRGIPIEIDLVIPGEGQQPVLGLLYEPQQVAAALEVKNSGSFGESTLGKVRHDFSRFREAGIPCAYVTLEERRGFRLAASSDTVGFPCFTLAWHRKAGGPIEPKEDWSELIRFLREHTGAQYAP